MTDPLCLMELNEFNKVVGVGWRLKDHEPVRLALTSTPLPGRPNDCTICASALGAGPSYEPKGILTRSCFKFTDFRAGDLRDLCRKMTSAARAAGDLPAFRAVSLGLDGATLTAECCGQTWTVSGEKFELPPPTF